MATKSRMISIRISNEEYRQVKARCTDLGDLKVSDFIRAAMMCAIAAPTTDSLQPALDLKVAGLIARVEKLERRLSEVVQAGGSSRIAG